MSFITEKYSDHTYAILRIVTGFLFFWHGSIKLFGFPIENVHEEPLYVIYTAGPIEVICGPLIALGLFTRPAAFLSCGLMAAAYFIAVAPNSLLPILSNGDLSVLFCFVLLHLSAKGSGIWSIDSLRQKS
jgi:putative oxidoreductase